LVQSDDERGTEKMCQHTCNNTIIPESDIDADYDNDPNDGLSSWPHIMIKTMIILLFLFCAAGEEDYTVPGAINSGNINVSWKRVNNHGPSL
jgi:hypothetical protein